MIGEHSRVHILKKPEVTDLAGEKVMIDFESGKYFLLSGSANDIWDVLEEDISIGAIVDRMMDVYDVERELCLQSTIRFLEKLAEISFIALT